MHDLKGEIWKFIRSQSDISIKTENGVNFINAVSLLWYYYIKL